MSLSALSSVPAGYVPFTDPAEVAFPAYRVFASGEHAAPNQPGHVMSRALLRAVLIDATVRNGGSMARDELTSSVMYAYDGLLDVFTAHPEPDHGEPQCATCGQWEQEHSSAANATSCERFAVFPVPGRSENLYCSRCRLPHLHHGRDFTVACDDFRALDLWGREITPFLTVRFIVLRDDRWVLANAELPANDMESAMEIVDRAKRETATETRGRTFLYVPAGYRRETDWQGEARFYGTEGMR